MSRLGNLIQMERMRKNISIKSLAKKSGVSEKYLQEVEAGKRIIQDEQARRILKNIGLEESNQASFFLEDIASAVDLSALSPGKTVQQQKGSKKPVAGSIWLDALSSVVKRVPIYNQSMQEKGRRLVPVTDQKIEGFNTDKVFYYQVPDNQMEGFNIFSGDLLLVVSTKNPADQQIMLIKQGDKYILVKIQLMDTATLLLVRHQKEPIITKAYIQDVAFAGRCIRLERPMPMIQP